MIPNDPRPPRAPGVPTRRAFLQTAAAAAASAGAGLALAGPARQADAVGAPLAAPCAPPVPFILNLAYAVEHCAMTLYYTALTSPALLHTPQLAGPSGTLQAVGRDGNAPNCAALQAALDQEQIHARILANLGATSPYHRFYFPALTFAVLGYTRQVGSFLWVLDHLETAAIAGYLTAVRDLATLDRPDLALMCVRNLAVECEHRALYRLIAGDDPADNMTLPVTEFPCLSDAFTFFTPYATGQGFPPGVARTAALPIPSPAQIARVVGTHRTA